MILSRTIDVEVLPNFFCYTVVDLNHYFEVFKDCVNDKGDDIPLLQKFTVAEIKARLDTVKYKSFYITFDDDSQLVEMLAYLNSFYPYKLPNGQVNRTDCSSFNGIRYDDLMIAFFMMNATRLNTKELITGLYNLSKKIISSQDDKDTFRKDFQLMACRRFGVPYTSIDLMQLFALNKAGSMFDKETGEKKPIPKSLKQTSINLQWYELLEYEMPPIGDKDLYLYKEHKYGKNLTAKELNRLVDGWDRYIIPEYIPPMMYYNKNDNFILCELARLNKEEIRSRYSISNAYNVNVLSASRSGVSDVMFEKLYSEFSGLTPRQWKGKKTERTVMNLGKLIFDNICFKTAELNKLLSDIRTINVTRTTKESFSKSIAIADVTYTMAMGGLHSVDCGMEIWSNTEWSGSAAFPTGDRKQLSSDAGKLFTIWHADVTSFYPSIMGMYLVAPAHLIKSIFAKLVLWIRDTRIHAKHSIEEFINGIQKDILALVLKIVINSIYGKFGYEHGDLYDRRATLETTINGQLMLLMLAEELELNDIHIISANTDGLMLKVYKEQEATAKRIIEEWQTKTKMNMDIDKVECLIARDVNNYIALFRDEKKGKLKGELKGNYDPLMYAKDLTKGYDMPVVRKAVYDYFIKGVPVLDTLRNETHILEFCKTQNVGRQFKVAEVKTVDGQIVKEAIQRHVRYYISNRGTVIQKVHNIDGTSSRLAAGERVRILNTVDDLDITLRDINYRYYYNEAMKLIDPIKQGISNKNKKTMKKNFGMYNKLFD